MNNTADLKKTTNRKKRLTVIHAIIWLRLLLLLFGLYPYRFIAQPLANPNVSRKQVLRRRRLHLPQLQTPIAIHNEIYKIVFSVVGLSITLLHLLLISGSYVLIVRSGFSERHSAQFSVMPTSKLAVLQRRVISTLTILSTFLSLIQTLMGRKQTLRRLKIMVRLDREFSSAGVKMEPLYQRLYWHSLISTLVLLAFLATQIYHQTMFYLNGKHQQFNAISMFIICWLYVMPIIYKQVQVYACAVYINQIRSHFELMNKNLLQPVLREEGKRQSMGDWFEEE